MTSIERLFVVGHPGAGKGLFAKSIAKAIGWNFVDADLCIEHKVGLSLADILGESGLKCYGQTQCKVIQSLLNRQHVVIATDGAIVNAEEAKSLLSDEAVVFLNTSTKTQLSRVARSPDSLTEKADYEHLFDELHQLRDQSYMSVSNLVVDGNHSDIERQVGEVIEFFGPFEAVALPNLTSREKTLFHAKTHEKIELTSQQAHCLRCLVKGLSSKETAQALNISHRTVEAHISVLKEKLGCESSKDLVALYHDVV